MKFVVVAPGIYICYSLKGYRRATIMLLICHLLPAECPYFNVVDRYNFLQLFTMFNGPVLHSLLGVFVLASV